MKKLIWLILPITFCCTNLLSRPELTMQTHGYLSFEKYIQAQTKKDELYHGYRSELMANINFLRWNRFYLDGLLGNMTIMSHPDSALWNIERIHYTLNPGFRIEFKNWLIKGALQHDCFHRVNQYDKPLPGLGRGSIWWNTYQIGIGSKGAYSLSPQNPFKIRVIHFSTPGMDNSIMAIMFRQKIPSLPDRVRLIATKYSVKYAIMLELVAIGQPVSVYANICG